MDSMILRFSTQSLPQHNLHQPHNRADAELLEQVAAVRFDGADRVPPSSAQKKSWKP
jgi:hypothetical protein